MEMCLADTKTAGARDWRALFPVEGPSAEAPLADRQLYLRLRYMEIVRSASELVTRILRDYDSKKNRPDSEDVYPLTGFCDHAQRDLSNLKIQAQMLRAAAKSDDGIEVADIDTVAAALASREGLKWDAPISESGPVPAADLNAEEFPPFDASAGAKRAWFQKASGRVKDLTDALGRKSGEVGDSRSFKEVVRTGQKVVTLMMHALRDMATLSGVTKSSREAARASKAAMDDLAEECVARQVTARLSNPFKIRAATIQAVVEDIKKARNRYFPAYWNLVGYTQSGKTGRMLMELTPAHDQMVRGRMAHLLCRACGAWHGQSIAPAYDPETQKRSVLPATCPFCGQKDCAGQRKHRVAGCRELGKTTLAAVAGSYDYGLLAQDGYLPEWVVVGSNQTEAKKRLGQRVAVMRRPGHRLTFPAASPSSRRAGGLSVRLAGQDTPTISCFGIESLPPGTHPDILDCDDVVNEDNTFTKPAKIETVQSKVSNVIDYSQLPWTLLNWYTTVWRESDADDRLEKYALAHPREWTNTIVAVTGSPGNWISPWPNRWTPAQLHAMYEKDEFAFRRAMMMQRIMEGEIVFHSVGLWYWSDGPKIARCPAEVLEGYAGVSHAQMATFPRVLGVDLGFTGADKAGRTHSKTALCVVAIDPDTKFRYVLYSWSDYIKPGKHEETILAVATDYKVAVTVVERDKTVDELTEKLHAKGLTVDTYSPTALGSKTMRKMPVAAWFNQGLAAVQGSPMFVEGKWQMNPISSHVPLRNAALAFPSRQSDDLDALEIAIRKAEEYYGGEPKGPRAADAADDELPPWACELMGLPPAPERSFEAGVLAQAESDLSPYAEALLN